MKPDLSAHRQNTLLQETLACVRSCRDKSEELAQREQEQTRLIRSRIDAQRQQAKRQAIQKKDELENVWQQKKVAANDAYEAETKLTKAELQEEVDSTKRTVKQQLSDGEYDWFLGKQRLKKRIDADTLACREAHKVEKEKLTQHGTRFTDLADEAATSLGRHRCELKVHGGDLLDPPDDSDHLAAHQQTFDKVRLLIVQFRKTFWVRFQEERWYLIAFLVAMLGLPFPVHAFYSDWMIAGVISVVTALVSAMLLYALSRHFAGKAAQQFERSFANAIAVGRQQLLAAHHQNLSRRDRRLKNIEEEGSNKLQETDTQWQEKQRQLKQYLATRLTELQALANKRGFMLHQQFASKEEALTNQFQPALDELAAGLEGKIAELGDLESQQLAALKSELTQELDSLKQTWNSTFAAVVNESSAAWHMAKEMQVDLEQPISGWTPPAQPAEAIPFGRIPLQLSSLEQVPAQAGFELPGGTIEIPAAVDLLHAPGLMIDGLGEKDQAAELLRLIMVRMITSIPPGKLRFTIVDPVGLGESFSSFMHLADYDEEMIQHRIWTEPNHIQSRLADLTRHMENIIQTYLRNEFQTIQQYNDHAGEVAEAYRVLVIANFPAGFTDEAANRLQSIISSGPRCGVFTLLSFDKNQRLPRNFDLEEIRANTNVLILDDGKAHWQNEPIKEIPIQLDHLPSEEQISSIMHRVGSFAKEASKVEVPFGVVAPAAEEWWTADSRDEISVPLGRAGATKLQDLRLGRGTSQHVLISGKTGSGKSTLLHAMITNLSLKYSPDEVQFYLIDFKKGVEFKAYAELNLPHARVIAIESEREFGQSVLQRLDVELRRRGDLFRRVGVQSLAGYRDARPDERMPRVLLIIDEFQEFFVKEDKISQEASLLLDRLVRQGRAFGIHVLLGSQTLAGAYSLARATIGQMAVRIALQCSASDASLILSDDNDAARLLKRPGEAIYNDANGMVEGNHPFQVVWLNDVERESYLRELSQRDLTKRTLTQDPLEPAIVFEGNVTADAAKNSQLQNAWKAPAPQEVPLAPRAWLGEAVAIKEPPAIVFHRRSGANLMVIGQQDETALGVMASSLLGLATYSPQESAKRSQFIVFDGTRPESPTAGAWHNLRETAGIEAEIVKPRDVLEELTELHGELKRREKASDDNAPARFLFIYNLTRFRDLQRTEDDFGFGSFGEEKKTSPAEMFATILRDGPNFGIHCLLWSESYSNLMRWIDRPSLRDIESRVLFQMSATDSSNLMDSSAASQLGQHRAMFYSEDRGKAERFRPYGIPSDDFLLRVRSWNSNRNESSRVDLPNES